MAAHEPNRASERGKCCRAQSFLRTHFALANEYPLSTGSGYIITTKMLDLFKQDGEGIAGVERVLAELEREAMDPSAVQFLRRGSTCGAWIGSR